MSKPKQNVKLKFWRLPHFDWRVCSTWLRDWWPQWPQLAYVYFNSSSGKKAKIKVSLLLQGGWENSLVYFYYYLRIIYALLKSNLIDTTIIQLKLNKQSTDGSSLFQVFKKKWLPSNLVASHSARNVNKWNLH